MIELTLKVHNRFTIVLNFGANCQIWVLNEKFTYFKEDKSDKTKMLLLIHDVYQTNLPAC